MMFNTNTKYKDACLGRCLFNHKNVLNSFAVFCFFRFLETQLITFHLM